MSEGGLTVWFRIFYSWWITVQTTKQQETVTVSQNNHAVRSRVPRLTPTPATRSEPTQHQQTKIFSVRSTQYAECDRFRR